MVGCCVCWDGRVLGMVYVVGVKLSVVNDDGCYVHWIGLGVDVMANFKVVSG